MAAFLILGNTEFYRKIRYLTNEFRFKLHAKTDIAWISHESRLIQGKYLEMFYKCCSSSALFCSFLSTTISSGALFFVFSDALLSLMVFISSSVYVTIDPGTSSVIASPLRFVWLKFCLPFAGPSSQDLLASSLSRAKEVFYASPRICSSVQNKEGWTFGLL